MPRAGGGHFPTVIRRTSDHTWPRAGAIGSASRGVVGEPGGDSRWWLWVGGDANGGHGDIVADFCNPNWRRRGCADGGRPSLVRQKFPKTCRIIHPRPRRSRQGHPINRGQPNRPSDGRHHQRGSPTPRDSTLNPQRMHPAPDLNLQVSAQSLQGTRIR